MAQPVHPAERVLKLAFENGAVLCGVAPAAPLAEHGRFLRALADLPPSLSYLSRHAQKRAGVSSWFAGARCALMCAFPYPVPGPECAELLRSGRGGAQLLEHFGRKILQPDFFKAGNRNIARYAQGPDYHAPVREKLLKMLEGVRLLFPGADGRAFVDTSPVLEKELGRLAGLGFRGKNTLLINPEIGSYFVLGGLALDVELEQAVPLLCPGCADCGLCISACPTGALKDGRLLASKCISYLTTQAKERIPPGAALNAGGFAYGCDICQQVCPYNRTGAPARYGAVY